MLLNTMVGVCGGGWGALESKTDISMEMDKKNV